MTQLNAHTLNLQLHVVANFIPTSGLGHPLVVMVTLDQNLGTMQFGQKVVCLFSWKETEVTQMVDGIPRSNNSIVLVDQMTIHLIDINKRSVAVPDDVGMVVVLVRSEIDHTYPKGFATAVRYRFT